MGRALGFVLGLALILGSIETIQAATSTWSGASSTTWNTAGNWSGGIPASTGTALFASTVARSAVVVNTTGLQVGEIVFSGTVNESLTGTVADALTINNATGIDNQTASFNAQIGAALKLGGAAVTFKDSGTSSALTFTTQIELNGKALTFNTANAANVITVSGTIIDTPTGGSVTMSGSGTVIYSGANTYTGGTTISGGTLQINTGGSLGSNANITDNGALVYNLSTSPTVSTNIIGTGSLTQMGSGTLVLTGANSYSGVTTISGGTLQIGANSGAGSLGTGIVTDNAALVFDLTGTNTTAANITGTGTVTQSVGTMVLTGSNTYTGVTTIAANATLSVGNGGAGGTLTSSSGITDNGALIYNSTGNTSFSNAITGSGTLTKSGSGILILKSANSYTGDTTITGGSLQAGANNIIGSTSDLVITGGQLNLSTFTDAIGSLSGTSTGTVALGAGSVLTISDNANTTYAGTISGAGALVMNGNGTSGTLVLTGTNSYTGVTTIGANATLQVGDGTTNSSLTTTSGITDNGALVFDVTNSTSYTHAITGTGSLVMEGNGTTGTLLLTGSNSYTGATTIGAGATLQIGSGAAGGTLTGSSGITDNGALIFDTTGNTSFSNAITGSGTLTKESTGVLILKSADSYTGDTTIAGGSLQAGANNIIGSTSDVVITGGQLNLSTFTDAIGSLSGTGTGTVALGTGSVLTISDNANTTYAGTISGTGALVMNGNGTSGTLVLTGTNSYTGATTIGANATLQIGNGVTNSSLTTTSGITDNGALVFDVTNSTSYTNAITGTGSLVMEGNGTTGTLLLTGSNSYTGATTIGAGATLQIGSGAVGGTLTGSSGITDNGALIFDSTGNTSYSNAITGSGTLTKESTGILILKSADSYTGDTTITGGSLQAGANNIIGSTSDVVITGGQLNLSTFTDAIGSLSGTGTGTVALGTGSVLTISDNANTTYGGTISGTGALVMNGNGTSGTLVLTGTNSYTGATTIGANATLQIGNGATNSSLTTTSGITDNGALVFDVTNATSYANTIGGTGALVQEGSGTLILKSANSYTGDTSITAGSIQAGANNVIGSTSDVTITGGQLNLSTFTDAIGSLSGTSTGTVALGAGSVLTISDNANTTYGGTISGTGALVMNGNGTSGTLVLTGTNSYTGATTIGPNATLQVGNGTTNSALTTTTGITDNGALVFDVTNATSYAHTISGTGALVQEGSGTLILKVANTYTGDTSVTGGMLTVGIQNAIGSSSDVTVGSASAATLNLNSLNDAIGSLSGTATGTVTLGTGVLTISDNANTTFAGVITGAGGLAMNGNGTSGTLVLTGANTYTGATTIGTGATLQIGNGGGGSVAGSSAFVDNSALTIDVSGATTLAGAITGSGSLTVTAGTAVLSNNNYSYTGATSIGSMSTLQVGVSGAANGSLGTGTVADSGALVFDQNGSSTALGAISGSGALVQAGSGTTTLATANTYTGATSVNAGTLLITNASAVGSGATTSNQVSVNSGATLALSGSVKMTDFGNNFGVLQLNFNAGGAAATLASTGGVNSWESNINLGGASMLNGVATISETAGGLLYVGGGYANGSQQLNNISLNGFTLTLAAGMAPTQTPNYEFDPNTGNTPGGTGYSYAATNIFLNAPIITGTGGITVTGPGTVTILGEQPNTFTGTTTVTSGKLIVDGPSAAPSVISSNLVVIGTSGGGSAATLQMGQTFEVGATPAPNGTTALSNLVGTITAGTPNTTMVVYSNGTFDMNNGSEILANLTMQGGLINEGSYGSSTLLTVFGGISTLTNSAGKAQITNGAVGLAAANFTFNVVKGVASGPDLEIDSQLQDANNFTATGTQVGVIKTGGGTLMLQNDDSAAYGKFDIQQGVLAIQADLALGANTSTTLNHDNETIVETGAQLQLQLNPGGTSRDITHKTLTLNGDGGGTGALLSFSGTNTWAGYIYLNSASTIGASGNSSLLIGDPSGVGSNIIDANSGATALTTTGNGLITIDGGLSAQIGDVVKTGTGTTVLAGNDSYTGATNVSAGALLITNNSSLSGPTNGVTVTNNATLQIANNVTEVGIKTTINGAGNLSGNGAIESISGTNSYGGNITLASASQINADTGSNLTLLGNVANGGNLLTVGGLGNTTITGNVTGGGGLTMAGTGTLTLNNPTGAHNTYAGVTSVATGTLSFGTAAAPASNQIGTANQLAIAANATVNVNNSSQSIGTLTGNGTLNFGTSITSSVVQINVSGNDTFNGIFTGTGTIIIPSGADLILGSGGSGSLSYNGISRTFLDTGLNIELAGGTLTVANGSDDVFGTLTVVASTIPGDGPSVLNFASGAAATTSIDFTQTQPGGTGGVTIASGAQLNVTGWANTVDYFYSTNAPGVRFQTPLNQIVFDPPTPWSGSNTTWLPIADGPDTDHQITPVPEPSFYGAVVVGLAMGLVGFRSLRRRRKAA